MNPFKSSNLYTIYAKFGIIIVVLIVYLGFFWIKNLSNPLRTCKYCKKPLNDFSYSSQTGEITCKECGKTYYLKNKK